MVIWYFTLACLAVTLVNLILTWRNLRTINRALDKIEENI